jgi:hypothetical protein
MKIQRRPMAKAKGQEPKAFLSLSNPEQGLRDGEPAYVGRQAASEGSRSVFEGPLVLN